MAAHNVSTAGQGVTTGLKERPSIERKVAEMIKLGMLDFDTSHVVEFTKRLNHKDIAEEQFVEGAEVVIACPGESKIMPERILEYREAMKKLGVPLVEKPEEMIGKVDGMLIESQEGGVHLERARPFLEAEIPCFVDKPFTCGVADARKLIELAAKKKVPLFSASSLRYAPELVQFVADEKHGKVQGVLAYGPAPQHERNPGLYHYGIHAVEILYTLMGTGCERVTCTSEKDADAVTGQWRGGRLGEIRGLRPYGPYGFIAFTEKGAQHVSLTTQFTYRDLLKKVVEMFQTKKAPLDNAVTLEIVGFIEAAWKSGTNHGTGEKVSV
jgi:predicted dehydrogenase